MRGFVLGFYLSQRGLMVAGEVVVEFFLSDIDLRHGPPCSCYTAMRQLNRAATGQWTTTDNNSDKTRQKTPRTKAYQTEIGFF